METTFDSAADTLVDQIHDKVGRLEVGQERLVVQLGYVLETINRIELTLERSHTVSEEYREELLATVRRAEREIETIKREQELIANRRVISWIRRNYMLITAFIALATALLYLVRWLKEHLIF